MGTETKTARQNNMAIGNVADRGRAWWADDFEKYHFDGSIPTEVAREIIGWKPVQVPMTFVHPITGSVETYGDKKIVLRDDTLAPIGNNDGSTNLFDYWDWFINGPMRLLDTPELNLGFVGLFKGGSQAAVQIELSKTIVDDKTGIGYRPFLYAASSMDGSLAAQMGKAYTRIVCENTFSMAVGEAAKSGLFYKLRMTVNRKMDDNAARDALQIVHGMTDDITKELHAMCETTVTPKQWAAFLDAYAAVPEPDAKSKSGGRAFTTATKKRDELEHLWSFDNRVSPWAGTAFGVSQAVTTWTQNMSVVRNSTRVERNKLNMIQGKATSTETEALETLNKILATV